MLVCAPADIPRAHIPSVRTCVPAWCTSDVACVCLYSYSVPLPQTLIALLTLPFCTVCVHFLLVAAAWHMLYTVSEPSMHTHFAFESRSCCKHFVPLAGAPSVNVLLSRFPGLFVSTSFCRPVMWLVPLCHVNAYYTNALCLQALVLEDWEGLLCL